MSQHLVLDTNIVLDMLVFRDPRTHDLHAALFANPEIPDLMWLATAPMREELARVLETAHKDTSYDLTGAEGLWADLIGAALSRVDWRSIADHLKEE